MSDFIDELEQELRAASQRRLRLAAARLPRPRVRPGLPAAAARAVPVAVAVLIAIGVTVVVLTEVRHTNPRRTPNRHAVADRQQLVDILAPLRRRQTAADRAFPTSTLPQGPAITGLQGTPDISLIPYAATTPWGERIFLIPMKPASAASANRYVNGFPPRLRPQARHDIALRAARGETLSVFSARGDGGGDASAADIQAGNSFGTEAARSFAGGSTRTRRCWWSPTEWRRSRSCWRASPTATTTERRPTRTR